MYFVPIENLKELEATIESLLQSTNVMLLVRGIPGMGKSYVGKFVGEKFNAIQLETDQQFMTSGEYVYDPSKIEDAHTITQNEAKNFMIDAAPLVIVSNTFTQRWEMKSYEDLAAKYGYTLVVYDLFLQVLLSFPSLSHKNKPVSFLPADKQNQQQKNNKEYEEYLAHLARSNVHSVPAESMRSMSDRYEFLPQVVTITRNDLANKKPSGLSTSASFTAGAQASVAVLDTGRYLALDVLAPEDGPVLESSALYRQCMEGCHIVLETVGIVTGSAMIKKVVARNAASHGAAVAFNTKNTHTRNVSKLAAGLGRFHITVLTAAEYKLLKESGVLETFIAQLRGIDLSAISVKKQQSTKQSSLKSSGNGSHESDLALGVVTGHILDKQSIQSIKVDEVAKVAGLSADKHSTAFYLLCSDDTEGTTADTTAAASSSTPIRDMETLRLNFGLSNADFVPHVTLGFTHNDIHTKDNNRDSSSKDDTANNKTTEEVEKAGSVDGSASPVKVLLKRGSTGTESPVNSPNKSLSPAASKGGASSGVVNMRREGVSAFDAMYRTVHYGKNNSKINCAGAAVTSLTSDHLDLHLVLLVLHSETKVTFTRCFEFTVCDVKIRRTPCGDDAIYKTHRLLQSYLPRGCVFIQTLAPVSLLAPSTPSVGAVEHNAHGRKSEGDCVDDNVVFRPTGTSTTSPSGCLPVQSLRIFKGLFSLRKFFGKEGVEDDGVGYAEDQLNFKLNKILAATDTLILMEKVNGRAGSARFFQYNDTTFVIIGTKLSHLVCRVDFAAHTLVPPSWLTDASGNNSSNGDGDDEDNEDSGKLQLQQTNSGNKGHKAPKLSESQTSASSSAASGISLLREQQFERNALLQSNITGLSNVLHWNRLRDLVAFLGSHTLNGEVLDPEEMHLVTLSKHEWVSLCVSDFPPSITSAAASSEPQLDTLQLLQQLSQFVTALPEYTVYPLTHHPETGSALSVAEKRERLVRIADSLTFERDSEGKVMYFVQQQHTATSGSASSSRILDMMKYKTWWYVWRRSIREITSKLFTRYANHVHNISSGGSDDKLDGDGTPSSGSRGSKKQQQRAKKNDKRDGSSGSAPMSQLDKLTKQLNSMLLANKKDDAQHQKRLSDLIDQISKLQREEDLRNAPKETANGGEIAVSMTPFVEQLCKEIQNKWPSKFSFMKRELGEAYDKNIQGVMAVASAFLCWVQQQCSSGPGAAEFHTEFKKYYPVVWTRFLAETGHSDTF